MLEANYAVELAQGFNKDKWIQETENKLSEAIKDAASNGIREFSISLDELIVGAENLYEAGEMLSILNTSLDENGYENVITPDGVLIISW